jgi:sporulation protein YlmC with PRC-barrel domain
VAGIGVSSGAFTRAHHLRFSDLQTIGVDAVMVASAAVAQEGLSPAELRTLDDGLAGRPVVTESGQRVGEIAGYAVNTATGRLEAYRVRPETGLLARLTGLGQPETLEVPDAQVVALGAHALIVRDNAVPAAEPAAEGSGERT